MAHVDLLPARLVAALPATLPAPHAGAKDGRVAESKQIGRCDLLSVHVDLRETGHRHCLFISLPNELRNDFATRICGTGQGLAGAEWPASVSQSEANAHR